MSEEKPVELVNAAEEKPVETTEQASVEATGDVQEPAPTKEEFETLLSEGKKEFMLGNLAEAIEKLADASAFSVQLFGEFASETFDPHYSYGKALLELLSNEKGIIELKEDTLQNEKMLEQLKEGFKTLVQSLTENQGKDETEKEESIAEKKEEEAEKEPELMEAETTADKSNAEIGDETAETAEDDLTANDEEDLEDVENSQLAFESLDYARLVCEKNLASGDASTWLRRQKDTLVLLGQVALNDDNFETALNDLSTALKIVNEHFATDLREVAFLNMELSRVLRKTDDFSSAIERVDNAIKALEQFKAKVQAEPQSDEGKLLTEITDLLQEVVDEKELLRSHEADKENAAVTAETPADEFKTVDTLAIKRKEKRAATDDDNEPKKRKTADA